MQREERQHLLTMRERYAASLRTALEQSAYHGIDVPVHLQNEIGELERKIADIDRVLRPPRLLSRDIFQAMDEIERLQYSTTLALELQQAFGELRSEVRKRDGMAQRRDARQLAMLSALTAAGVLAQQPTLSWHLLLFVGVLVLVFAALAVDVWKHR